MSPIFVNSTKLIQMNQFKQPIFSTADHAFSVLLTKLSEWPDRVDGTGNRVMDNVGFYIKYPKSRDITHSTRKWSKKYAEREWAWYQSQNRSVEELKKHAPIWDNMHGGDNIVNSNYGWQLSRNDQFQRCINQLKENPNTRQAFVSIFDGKEKQYYQHDTPCTMSIGFQIIDGALCMSVNMRSNDLWYGFCNDQYCFSKYQEMMARELSVEVGWYYHHATNLHLYPQHFQNS